MKTLSTTRLAALVLPALLLPAAAQADDFAAHVPAGWQLTHTVRGDLNGDRRADAVLVLQQQDAAKIIGNDNLGPNRLNTNPRVLKVLFKEAGGYRLAAQSDELIPPEHSIDVPCLQDPLLDGDITADKGLLKVTLHYWLSCGSWGVAIDTYTFRWQQNRFRLIGLDHMEFMRNSGDKTSYSYNYLSGRKKVITGDNIFEGGKPRTRWEKLPKLPHYYLDGPLQP
ncbi:hypothetical protein L1281_000467 [Neisseria sp. HSC-16F19]|nr:hypothetical protein [Neisseria sp. HSC-16F19]MCP2039888.1 hypothetical protein [Neisseria sp. HSC-16F19]